MKKMNLITAMLAAILALSLTGCGIPANETAEHGSAAVSSAEPAEDPAAENTADTENAPAVNPETEEEFEVITVAQSLAADTENSGLFTERDLEQTADTSDAQYITVSDGKTIDITEEGVYVLSGTAQDCTVKVSADDTAKVQLVLDSVSITNEDFPAIYVVSADKVFVTTTGSGNTLSVTGAFISDGDTNTDAVIFSKDDLVLNGTGTLNVVSKSGNGITCKDDLKVTGGTYNVTAALDAFEANDSISVCDGVFTVNTNKDGFHCENDEAEGTVTITGGTFTVNAKSDGIQATALLQIDGGALTVTASEGLEASYIRINDGTVSITANDDGVNVSNKSASVSTPTFEMNGGSLTVTMSGSDVDGIDANGNIVITGGTIDITYPQQGSSEAFDYDGTADFDGGTVIINGQEVSEIPQSMMGGGMHGGFGGNMQGGFGGRKGGMRGSTDGSTENGTGGFGGFGGRQMQVF